MGFQNFVVSNKIYPLKKMAGMNVQLCARLQATPRRLHPIESLDKPTSVQHKVGGGKGTILLPCLSRMYVASSFSDFMLRLLSYSI